MQNFGTNGGGAAYLVSPKQNKWFGFLFYVNYVDVYLILVGWCVRNKPGPDSLILFSV